MREILKNCKYTFQKITRICEYIDGGAKGIVAPYVETVKAVKTLVGAVKLRPLKGNLLQLCLDKLVPGNQSLYKIVSEVVGAKTEKV